jgi:hypothetical protein
MRRRTTTRSSSLFGACCQRGSEFEGWRPLTIYLFLY